jgi:ABC-type cobalamin/Fe3+-siderophores transport system ATPase subunit
MNANANNIILILGPSSSGKTSLIDYFLEKNPSYQRFGIDKALVGGKTADFMQIEKENDKIIDIKITDFGLEKLQNHINEALISKNDIIMETIMIDERELKIFEPIMQKAQIFFLHTNDDILQQRENKRNSGLIAAQKRPVGAALVEAIKSEQMYNKIKDKYKVNYVDTTNKSTVQIYNQFFKPKYNG